MVSNIELKAGYCLECFIIYLNSGENLRFLLHLKEYFWQYIGDQDEIRQFPVFTAGYTEFLVLCIFDHMQTFGVFCCSILSPLQSLRLI